MVIWIHHAENQPRFGADYEEFLLRQLGEECREMRRVWTESPHWLDEFFPGGPAGRKVWEAAEASKAFNDELRKHCK